MHTRVVRRPWAIALGLAVAYVATARLGLLLALPPDFKATAVWPPSGLALAVVLLTRLRAWPGVWLGAFVANVWDAFSPSRAGPLAPHLISSAVIATGSTLQALAGAGLIRSLVGPAGALDRARDAFRFVAIVPLTCLIGATAGACAVGATGPGGWAVAPDVWWTWWIGDIAGALVVAPVVLCVARGDRPRRPPAEAVALFALLIGSCAIVFGGWVGGGAAPLAYLSLPLLVWAAVRFGPRGATLAVVVIAAFAVWATVRGTGPFVHADIHQALLLLDVFLAVVVVTSLVLSAVLREREAAVAALRASEAKFRHLTEAMPQIVWATAPDGGTAYLNRRWTEYTGLTGLSDAALALALHPDDEPKMRAVWATAQAAGGEFQHEFRLRAAAGAYRWFLARAVPVPGPGGAPGGWLGTSTDIDDLKRAQADLARQRAELQLILDTVPALIFYKDRRHRLVRVNNEMARVVGLPPDALLGHTDSELGAPHAADYRRQEEEIMRDGGPVRTVVEPLFTFTGTRWLQTTKVPYRDETGRVIGLLGLSVDVTDQKQAEAEVRRLNEELERRVAERTAVAEARARELQSAVDALREQKQLLETILDSLGDAVLVADRDGRVLLQNRAFQRLHPVPAEHVTADVAQRYGVYLPDGVTPCPLDRLPVVRAVRGESCDDVELLIVDAARPDGVPVSVTGRPVVGPNGIEGGVIVIRDVSAARRSEAALRESEARFRAIFDQAFQFIGLMSTGGTLLEANRTALAAAGLSDADVIGKPFWDTAWWSHDPEQQARLRDAVARAAGGETIRFEATHAAADGTPIRVDFSLKPFRDHTGAVRLLIPEGRDITAIRRAAEELSATEALLRQFIKHAPAAIAMLDADMRYVQASDRWLTDYKLSERDIIGRSHYAVFPDVPERWKAVHRRVLAGAVEACPEEPFPRADGAVEWLQWECRPWRAAGGEVGGLIMFTQVVTERVRADEALRESEARFRGAFDHAPIGIALVSPEGRWLKANQALCQMLGYEPGELLATDFQTLTHPDDLSADVAQVEQVLSGALAAYQMEKRYIHKGGHTIHALLAVSLVRGARGEPLYFVSQIKDITERKRAETELREQAAFIQGVLDAMPAHIAVLDRSGAIVAVNRAWHDTGAASVGADGRLPQTGAGTNYLDVCARSAAAGCADAAAAADAIRRVLDGHAERAVLDYACHARGARRWFLMNVTPLRHGRGAAVVSHTDVTDQRLAEERRRESEERSRSILDHSPAVVYLKDLEGRYQFVNRRGCELLGLPPEAWVGRTARELFPPDLAERFEASDRSARAAMRAHEVEEHATLPGGRAVTMLTVQFPLVGSDGRPYAICGIATDVTERKRAEAALRASEEQYRAVVQALAEGVVVQDRAGAIVACNDRAAEILGLTRDQMLGRTSRDPRWGAVCEDGAPFPGDAHPAMAVLRTGRPQFNTPMGVRTPDGALRWLSINSVPLAGPDPTGAAVVTSFHDVTAVREASDRLRASVREKEVMLKEIHHRVKNNLQIISTLLELQGDGLTDPAAVAAFRESRGRVRSMSLIHERLYRSEDLAGVEFGPYLRGLAEDLFRAYRADDEAVRLEVAASVPPLPLDLAIPCGLLVNELISNCLKYAFVGRSRGNIQVSLVRTGAGAFVLTVVDDGVGMPAGFDIENAPSFGLQLVSTLAAQLRGAVELAPGPGTRVTVQFPARG
ncbi:PAS domain S-box protein [Gemmata sp. JC717]|uniref:PAS domain S-box protein n=1 Tax=Gemmata algarum TaxID=2975278 RepID=UPI0021BACA7B|nr:PAS domain S-box protein [Gemmata algarum]MDY3556519.1 PAS domain S-box protein [Gemmata algarum]